MGNKTIKIHLALYLCEDILDHGVPRKVNSAYSKSAYIPLAKTTTQNIQKCAISSQSKQLTATLKTSLWHQLTCHAQIQPITTLNYKTFQEVKPNTPVADWQGTSNSTFKWKCNNGISCTSDNVEKDCLPLHITQHPVDHFLLPQTPPDSKQTCTTEFIWKGHQYHGRPRNDHATVKWHGFDNPMRWWLPPGMRIKIPSSDQPPIERGVYALVHSFAAVDKDEMDIPNSMIGWYTVYQHSPKAMLQHCILRIFNASTHQQ